MGQDYRARTGLRGMKGQPSAYTRHEEASMATLLLLLAALEGPAPAPVPPGCESARLVAVRSDERAERTPAGPLPPAEGGRRERELSPSTVCTLFLRCEGDASSYEARAGVGATSFDPGTLQPGTLVHLRAVGAKVLLRPGRGHEFGVTLTRSLRPPGPQLQDPGPAEPPK